MAYNYIKDEDSLRMIYVFSDCQLYYDRVGFAAEQLAKWIAERTDIQVSVNP